MKDQDILDVLALRDIIAESNGLTHTINRLIEWRDSTLGTVEAFAPQQDHSAAEDAAATVEAKAPAKAPAPKAPAKTAAKGRAKPPPPPADDDGPSPDPSDDSDF